MAPLAKKWFKATGDLHPRIAGHLITDSFGQPVANVLARLDWDGNLVACIGLELYKAAVISTAPYISTHIFLLYFFFKNLSPLSYILEI
jgi:hypothetical protein